MAGVLTTGQDAPHPYGEEELQRPWQCRAEGGLVGYARGTPQGMAGVGCGVVIDHAAAGGDDFVFAAGLAVGCL